MSYKIFVVCVILLLTSSIGMFQICSFMDPGVTFVYVISSACCTIDFYTTSIFTQIPILNSYKTMIIFLSAIKKDTE